MKPFFKELAQYHHHFNQKVADAMLAMPDKVSEKALKLFSHSLNAHRIWNNRIEAVQPPLGVWDIHALNQLKGIDTENHHCTIYLLDKCELDAQIKYTTTNGESYNNTVGDILFHVFNHHTYHRAQIATEFKQSSIQPLAADYIGFKRQAISEAGTN